MADNMYLTRKNRENTLINISQFPVSDSVALKNALIELNGTTVEYGLVLTVKQINNLTKAVRNALIESDRIELGAGILPLLAEEFSSSIFIKQENYAEVLEELIHIFFKVKTAVCDTISDRELLRLLKDFYENKALGSVELMRDKDIDLLVKYIEMENGQNDGTEGDVYESDGYTDERA